tara:strand:+ start:379 stop:579 length:201 start_codon:yes stop_codon:yes gene_type:complete
MKHILNFRNLSTTIKKISTPLINYKENREKIVQDLFKIQEKKSIQNSNIKESYYNMYNALKYLKIK